MNAVIIFDTNSVDNDASVIRQMIALGYSQSWKSNEKGYLLPHNTLWKPNTELKAAKVDLDNVIAFLNIQAAVPNRSPVEKVLIPNPYMFGRKDRVYLKRCIILSSTPWTGIEGER
jgi:hypothetical protein